MTPQWEDLVRQDIHYQVAEHRPAEGILILNGQGHPRFWSLCTSRRVRRDSFVYRCNSASSGCPCRGFRRLSLLRPATGSTAPAFRSSCIASKTQGRPSHKCHCITDRLAAVYLVHCHPLVHSADPLIKTQIRKRLAPSSEPDRLSPLRSDIPDHIRGKSVV